METPSVLVDSNMDTMWQIWYGTLFFLIRCLRRDKYGTLFVAISANKSSSILYFEQRRAYIPSSV